MAEMYTNTDDYGNKYYYKDPGKRILHREDGPAIEYYGGTKEWLRHGLRHRLDGPAVKYSNGSESWYVDGIHLFSANRDNILQTRMHYV